MAAPLQWSNLVVGASQAVKQAVCGNYTVEISFLDNSVAVTNQLGQIVFNKKYEDVYVSEDGVGRGSFKEYHLAQGDQDRREFCRLAENHFRSVSVSEEANHQVVPVFSTRNAEQINLLNN